LRVRSVFKPRAIFEKCQPHLSYGSIPLLRHRDIGNAAKFRLIRSIDIDLLAKNEHDHLGVLFNRSRLAQASELRAVIAAARFRVPSWAAIGQQPAPPILSVHGRGAVWLPAAAPDSGGKPYTAE